MDRLQGIARFTELRDCMIRVNDHAKIVILGAR